jgi:acetyltransferase-like isoleucine patch superfamily enzyme
LNDVFGNNFHSGPKCRIITVNHNFNEGNAIPYDSTNIVKDVVIEDNVWLGYNVLILGGVRIGEGAIIQAGSVVVSDVPKYGIAGGHPAKVFSERDVDHYNKLKEEGKFH